MKKILVFTLFIGVLVTPTVVGRDWRTVGGTFNLSLRSGQAGAGFFGFPSGGASIGIFPVLHVPREVATVFLLDRFLFGRPSGRVSSRDSFFLGRGSAIPWLRGSAPFRSEPNYTSRSFVQEWKDRPPVPKARSAGLTESILLSEEMSQEGVMELLGSPVQRVRLGERELWKYSGYSLLFETGRLQEIR